MKRGHLYDERGTQDNFFEMTWKGTKWENVIGPVFYQSLKKLNLLGKFTWKKYMKEGHSIHSFCSSSWNAVVSNKSHQYVNQQTKGTALRGSTWVIIRWEKRQNKAKGEREPEIQECSVSVKRNKEKETEEHSWTSKWLCSISELQRLTGTEVMKPSNIALLFTILWNQTRCRFKNIVGKHV